MGNCLEIDQQQPEEHSHHHSSVKQQSQSLPHYHSSSFVGKQHHAQEQSRLNSSVGQQPQYQQQSRPPFWSMPTDRLIRTLENEFTRTLMEIQTMKRNKRSDERTRKELCHIIRETEQKLCIFNCEMSKTRREEEAIRENTLANLRHQLHEHKQNAKSLTDRIESNERNNKQLNETIAALKEETRALANENFMFRSAEKKTEPNKTSSKYMVSQMENKANDKQANTTREEKARHEKTVADLKEQLTKKEEIAKSLTVRIGNCEDYNRQLKESLAELEREKRALAEEKDNYVLRLSKLAGQRLVDDNPAIADLSDPNRPIKLGEMYSEIYDNEWTCALDALMSAGYDEKDAILTLRLTLLNILDYCKTKSDTLLKKTEDAVNFLFKEIKDSEDKKPKKHLTMTKSQSKELLKLTKDSLLDAQPDELINLPERWIPKKRYEQTNTEQSFETVKVKKPDGVAKRLTLFRKEVAESMVPIVQKAYMAASWEDSMFIPELKPFIKKCIFLGWMMVVQAPPMALITCQEGQPLDKNMFKEYTRSGPEVEYLVWPALQLHESGPLIGKGIAQGRGKQMKHNKNNTQF